MRLLALFQLLLAATALTSSALVHADQLDGIRRQGQLVIGVLGTDEPNSFLDPKTRELIGYEVDLGRAIAAQIGVKPVFKQLAVAARIPELQQAKVDLLAASLTHLKERETQIDFSITTFITGQKVMVKQDSPIHDVQQLDAKRVLTVKGGTQEPNTRRVAPTASIITFETQPQAFLALQQGKGAAYVDDEFRILDSMHKLGDKARNYRILPTNLSVEPIALGIRKGETRLKKVVDQTLRELEANGQAEQLFQKWYGPSSKLKMPRREFRFDSDRV